MLQFSPAGTGNLLWWFYSDDLQEGSWTGIISEDTPMLKSVIEKQETTAVRARGLW